MNLSEVKAILPPVRGIWSGKIWSCMVTGRMNAFATVSPHSIVEGGRIRSIIGPCYQVAWATVAQCIENGKPVLLDAVTTEKALADQIVEYKPGAKSPAALKALALIHIRADGPVSFHSIHRFVRTQGQLPDLCPCLQIMTALNELLHERRIELYDPIWNAKTQQYDIAFTPYRE